MKLGNQQPYFFPYFAYWQLLNLVDLYVIADNVQFSKKSFINRNYILLNGQSHRITLEVVGVHLGIPINKVQVGRNLEKIRRTIFYAYKKAPYFNDIFPIISDVLMNKEKNLAKFIQYSIESISNYLDINTKIVNESDLNLKPSLSAQSSIIEICKLFNANNYINAVGGLKLYSKNIFEKNSIKLNFLKMDNINYNQRNKIFIPNLSIIDVLMFNKRDEVKNMLSHFTLI